jgi:hypothetical protein
LIVELNFIDIACFPPHHQPTLAVKFKPSKSWLFISDELKSTFDTFYYFFALSSFPLDLILILARKFPSQLSPSIFFGKEMADACDE